MCNDKTAPRRRHLFRFGVRTLFVVVTCVAAYLAGHRTGFYAGYTKFERPVSTLVSTRTTTTCSMRKSQNPIVRLTMYDRAGADS